MNYKEAKRYKAVLKVELDGKFQGRLEENGNGDYTDYMDLIIKENEVRRLKEQVNQLTEFGVLRTSLNDIKIKLDQIKRDMSDEEAKHMLNNFVCTYKDVKFNSEENRLLVKEAFEIGYISYKHNMY